MCLTFIVLIFHSGINGFHYSICRFQVTLSPCKSAILLPVQHPHVAGATSARVTHFLGSQHQFVRNSDIYLCLLLKIFMGRVTRSTLKCFNLTVFDGKGKALKRTKELQSWLRVADTSKDSF